MKFEELNLNHNILSALADMHFENCTPIQEKCIPPLLEGKDLLGVAQTGTGKTAAYLLPILSKLSSGEYPDDKVNCLIMAPTRELAQQIDDALLGFAYYDSNISSIAVYGGNDGNRYDQEVKSLKMGVDIIIATPGRLISHLSLGNVDLGKVSFFVLDEADRMLDMGFSEDIMNIARHLPENCQTIMFSATMPSDIEKMAQNLLKNPVKVMLAVSKPADNIKQSAYICYETQKIDLIKKIFTDNAQERVIIFCKAKRKVRQVANALKSKHIDCGEMHSDLSQEQRDEIMLRFKSRKLNVLVATDILSRGIDIDDISLVINYDVPNDPEDYVHRIGRTARADKNGRAITFVNQSDMKAFAEIEKFLEKPVPKNPMPEEMGKTPDYQSYIKDNNSSKKSDRPKNKGNNRKNNRKKEDKHSKELKTTTAEENAGKTERADNKKKQNNKNKKKQKDNATATKDRQRNGNNSQNKTQNADSAPEKLADNQSEGKNKNEDRNENKSQNNGNGQRNTQREKNSNHTPEEQNENTGEEKKNNYRRNNNNRSRRNSRQNNQNQSNDTQNNNAAEEEKYGNRRGNRRGNRYQGNNRDADKQANNAQQAKDREQDDQQTRRGNNQRQRQNKDNRNNKRRRPNPNGNRNQQSKDNYSSFYGISKKKFQPKPKKESNLVKVLKAPVRWLASLKKKK